MNDIEENELFQIDIVAMYKETLEALRNGGFSKAQEWAIVMYVNGVIDMFKDRDGPAEWLTEVVQVAETLDEMWQYTIALIEDIEFRRAFVLICRGIHAIADWEDRQLTYTQIVDWCRKELE